MCRKLFSICLLLFLLLIFPFTYAVLAAPDQPDIVGGASRSLALAGCLN
jgi:hypothetical protein